MARPLQADDLYLLRTVTDCALHPDGERAAYVVSWCDRDTDANRSQIWMHDHDEVRPLTQSHVAMTPRFSPDGRWLAYLCSSAKKKPSQLLVLSLAGGEPMALTDMDDGVGEPTWLPDSSGLVLTAPVRPDELRGKTTEQLAEDPRARRIDNLLYRFNGRGFIHERRHHIFVVYLPIPGQSHGDAVQLTSGPWDHVCPVPSPDGTRVACISGRHDDREWVGGNDVWTVPIDGGDPHPLTKGGVWSAVQWRPDGRDIIAIGHDQRGTVALYVPHVLDAGGDRPVVRLGDGEINASSLAGGAATVMVSEDSVMVAGLRRGAVHIDRYDLDTGERSTVVGGWRAVGSFGSVGDRMVFVASGSNTPAELFEVRAGAERQLTTVTQPFLDEASLVPVEAFTTVSADGYPVHGFVCGPQSPGPHAGLVYVHGGPLAQYTWGFFDEFQLAAAQGYVVIGANPRGSDGYGQAHADAITGDFGGLDWLDVQAATDVLTERPDVDETRIGIGGGSYGGFMTAWATAHTDRYVAAVVERAVINWETMESTSDIGWFVKASTGGDTVDDCQTLRRQSPITHVGSVTTPTLVIHSEEDWRCPPEQGEQWFAALRRRGVACQFVRFPGENHELTRSGRPSLRIERFGIVHDWFANYLA